MTDNTEDQATEPSQRNWKELREWMNVLVAAAALFVAIVSFWTTAQISGLEDYFRSEISRRNSELNRLADDTDRVRQAADARERQLSELATSADRVVSNYVEAQSRLQEAQNRLSGVQSEALRTQFALAETRRETSGLRTEIGAQKSAIDLFRRQRAYESSLYPFLSGFESAFDADYRASGNLTLQSLAQINPPTNNNELIPYFEEMRPKARQLCSYLEGYEPDIPPLMDYPAGPRRYGERVETPRGVGYSMTEEESRLQDAEWDRWNGEWSRVSEHNSNRLKRIGQISAYLRQSANRCVCLALATAEHSAAQICPGGTDRPQRPSFNEDDS